METAGFFVAGSSCLAAGFAAVCTSGSATSVAVNRFTVYIFGSLGCLSKRLGASMATAMTITCRLMDILKGLRHSWDNMLSGVVKPCEARSFTASYHQPAGLSSQVCH